MHHAHAGEAALVPRRGEDSPRARAQIAAALQYPDPVPAGKLQFGEDRVGGMLPQQGLRDAGIAGDVDVEMAAESMAEPVYDLGVGFDEQNTLHAVPTVCARAGELKSCVTSKSGPVLEGAGCHGAPRPRTRTAGRRSRRGRR